MRFLVSEVRNAGRVDQDISVDPISILGNPPEFVSFLQPLKVTASAVMTGDDIVVSGHIESGFGFSCGRCLDEFERPYRADFQQVFNADENEIDVSPDIKEVVYVDLPLIPICRDDCKGLCPTCGKNRNVVACGCVQTHENPKWNDLIARYLEFED